MQLYSPNTVRVDLVFLRKTFKGRFLLIDQEYGIGADGVLNHLTLILDGKQLSWEEFSRT
jgi:hypothetical protein